jgi:hypothetical protein
MERNTETLSTRDLASPNEPAGAGATSEDDVRDTAAPEGQPGVDAPARDQSIEAPRSSAGLATEGGASGHAAEDGPAKSTQPVPTQDQDANTEAAPQSTGAAASTSNGGSLLPADMDATFQQRWKEIQTRFVDEPRGAVEDADGLVANLMQQLAEGFAKERERLEAQWGRGEDISTEDLRVALQRYRTFFQRLLST